MNFKVDKAVFFDLDGTLIDSAIDLVDCANNLRTQRGLPPLPYEYLKNFVSRGTPAMIGEALGIHKSDTDYESIKIDYLTNYRSRLTKNLRYFDGIPELLDSLDSKGIAWGIVTNKPSELAIPLLKHLGLDSRCIASTYGDSALNNKPHTDTILLACKQADVDPSKCIYVGDDERDILAGKAANMKTIVLTYGYCPEPQNIPSWDADYIANNPGEIELGIIELFCI
ncbi:HAD family hydrolase [Taylorella equigenitalis]|uniref:HAD family hydrolase n=1 Tax=Taylorella equigenitalis TaxID=29575 RepID=UPI00237EAB27|nr:HAD-IA family hydrolase [Taylorella equigenitalis]WDU52349.1 HAD-IA family hydrolase [Taylorella equigenitalis]